MELDPKSWMTAGVKNLAQQETKGILGGSPALSGMAAAAKVPAWYLQELLDALPPSEKANILDLATRHPNNPLVALQALMGASPSLTAPFTGQIKKTIQAPAEALDVANQMVSGLPMTSPDVPSTAPGIQTRFTPEQLIAKKAAMHAGAKAKLPPPYFASAFPPNWDELPDEEKIRWYQANPGKAPLEGVDTSAIREAQNAAINRLAREKHGSIKAYDSSTGRSWDNSMSPTGEVQQTNTGDFNTVTGHVTTPSGIPMQSPSQFYSTPQVAPGGMGAGRAAAYIPQRGTTASPITPSDPSQASEYVQAQLARQQGRATEDQLGLLQLKNELGLEQARTNNPYEVSVIRAAQQGRFPPRQPVQHESRASEIQATLAGLAHLRDQQAMASVESRVARLGVQVSPEKLEELYNHERQKLAANPDAELNALAPRYRPDPYAGMLNQTPEEP